MSFIDSIKGLFGGTPKNARVFHVTGMHCAHCEQHTSEAVSKIDGVKSVRASAKKNEVIVTADPSVKDEDIKKAISDAGFTVE